MTDWRPFNRAIATHAIDDDTAEMEMPRQIRSGVELRAIVTLWVRFNPSRWVPVQELRILAAKFGRDVLEKAITSVGEKNGEVSIESLQPVLDLLCRARERDHKRDQWWNK